MSLNYSVLSASQPATDPPKASTDYSSANEDFEMSLISKCSTAKMKIDDQISLSSNGSFVMADGYLDASSISSSNSTHITNGCPDSNLLPCEDSQFLPTTNGDVSSSRDPNAPNDNGHLPNEQQSHSLTNNQTNGQLVNGSIGDADISPIPRPTLENDTNPTRRMSEPTQAYSQSKLANLSNGHSNPSNGSIASRQLDSSPSMVATPLPSAKFPLSLVNGFCREKKKKNKKTPFPLLPGEEVTSDEALNEGYVYLTNYRLHVEPSSKTDSALPPQSSHQQQEQLISLPIGVIDSVEIRDLYFLVVFTKYVQSFILSFNATESATYWQRLLSSAVSIKVPDLFCFRFFKSLSQDRKSTFFPENRIGQLANNGQREFDGFCDPREMVIQEFKRMKFNPNDWRICELNKDFRFSQSYPGYFIVPRDITDKELESVANFRFSRRIPAAVWRNPKNGCVIARSAQPVIGWFGWRSNHDEKLLETIQKICYRDTQMCSSQRKDVDETDSPSCALSQNGLSVSSHTNGINSSDQPVKCSDSESKSPDANGQANGHATSNGSLPVNKSMEKLEGDGTSRLLILDARTYTAAVANRAVGGGVECSEYYTNCEVIFQGLSNIHGIRKSFYALRYICEASQIDHANWLTQLDNTKWLYYLGSLLQAALVIVDNVSIYERPVLVHCSDGWDRTPQIVTLAQLMLDPYYRTIDGFRVLVEREWLQFGHKFTDRCRSTSLNIDLNERCPVFLQWLDCVHQLIRQFPCEFEFNAFFLTKLVYHTYSSLFGTFIGNNVQERMKEQIYQNTFSIWSFVQLEKSNFTNYLYKRKDEILRPSYRVKDMVLWNDVYVPVSGTSVASIVPMSEPQVLHSPDCSQEDISKNGNIFVKRNIDSSALNEAYIDESAINCKDQEKCQISKCTLHRSASCDDVLDSKTTKSYAMRSHLGAGSLHAASSQSLGQKHLSDSCLYESNEMTKNKNRDTFLSFSAPTNHPDCDSELQSSNGGETVDKVNGVEEKTREDVTPILNSTNLRTCSLGSRLYGKRRYKDSSHRPSENGNEADCLPTDLWHMVHSNSPAEPIDIDGQIVVKDKSYVQLQQMIIYYQNVIRNLSHKVVSSKKSLGCVGNQVTKSAQLEDSNNPRRHSNVNGDFNHRPLDILDLLHCDNATPTGAEHCPSGRDANRLLSNGTGSNHAKDSSRRPRSVAEGSTVYFAEKTPDCKP